MQCLAAVAVLTQTSAMSLCLVHLHCGPSPFQSIIRFVMPNHDNHQLKKLLLVFWEIIPKHGPDGKLLPEMILVCDAYRRVSGLCPNRTSLTLSETAFCCRMLDDISHCQLQRSLTDPRSPNSIACYKCRILNTRTSSFVVVLCASCANSKRPSSLAHSCRRS